MDQEAITSSESEGGIDSKEELTHVLQQPFEMELTTKILQIQSKRYYIDAKQNRRGRFIKIAEMASNGIKNKLLLSMSSAEEFRDHLSSFIDIYASLGPQNHETLPESGKFKSEMIVSENRRYYLDLKENSRGRFLRVSQTISPGGQRAQIAIPAQGLVEFRNAITDILVEHFIKKTGSAAKVFEPTKLNVENKNFYFDIGENNREIYMRISEVRSNFRTTITIPANSWMNFRDIFSDYVNQIDALRNPSTSAQDTASLVQGEAKLSEINLKEEVAATNEDKSPDLAANSEDTFLSLE